MEKIRFAVSSRSAKMFAAISAVSSVVLCAALIITVGSWMMTAPAWAQAAPSAAPTATATTANIHGHAQDPLSQPMANTKVEITTDGKTALFTFTTDANGDYKGTGIKPGTYSVMLFGDIKGKDGKHDAGHHRLSAER